MIFYKLITHSQKRILKQRIKRLKTKKDRVKGLEDYLVIWLKKDALEEKLSKDQIEECLVFYKWYIDKYNESNSLEEIHLEIDKKRYFNMSKKELREYHYFWTFEEWDQRDEWFDDQRWYNIITNITSITLVTVFTYFCLFPWPPYWPNFI